MSQPTSSGPLSTWATISSSLREGLETLLGIEKVQGGDPTAVIRIRRAMLRLHGEDGRLDNPRLHQRLRHTRDAEGLWYARAELYADLCQRYNEVYAIQTLASVRPLFDGTLPPSLLKARMPGGLAARHQAPAPQEPHHERRR